MLSLKHMGMAIMHATEEFIRAPIVLDLVEAKSMQPRTTSSKKQKAWNACPWGEGRSFLSPDPRRAVVDGIQKCMLGTHSTFPGNIVDGRGRSHFGQHGFSMHVVRGNRQREDVCYTW